MCNTIAIGAARVAGSAAIRRVSAWGPPVEAPIMINSTRLALARCTEAGATTIEEDGVPVMPHPGAGSGHIERGSSRRGVHDGGGFAGLPRHRHAREEVDLLGRR